MVNKKAKGSLGTILILGLIIFGIWYYSTLNKTNLKYRAGSLDYPTTMGSYSWIAWSDVDLGRNFTCGDNLVGYGYSTKGTTNGTCGPAFDISSLLLSPLPHISTVHLTPNGAGIFSLMRVDIDTLMVCESTADGNSGFIKYTKTAYPSTSPEQIDIQPTTLDSTREVTC